MNRVASRYGVHHLFQDFLDILICCFSNGQMENRYRELIDKYQKPEAYSLSEALGALTIEMIGPDGQGFIDVLGKYYMEHVATGHIGQFFTPMHICNLLARLNNPEGVYKRIFDPACGSGRMLMATGKINPHATFFGADLDGTCAKMTVINLCLNKLYGQVAWQDSLSGESYAAWEIYPTEKGYPAIREIAKNAHAMYFVQPEKPWQIPNVIKANHANQLIFNF
jgi:hypothetical protein